MENGTVHVVHHQHNRTKFLTGSFKCNVAVRHISLRSLSRWIPSISSACVSTTFTEITSSKCFLCFAVLYYTVVKQQAGADSTDLNFEQFFALAH